MKKLKTGLSVLLFLMVLAYALTFSVHNNQLVTLDFLIGNPVAWPLALWIGLAVFAGAVLGLLSGMVLLARQKLQIRRLHKELNDTRQRLNKLA